MVLIRVMGTATLGGETPDFHIPLEPGRRPGQYLLTIPAGFAQATIQVTPYDDPFEEAEESVVLILRRCKNVDCVIDAPGGAEIKIISDDQPSTAPPSRIGSLADHDTVQSGLDGNDVTITWTEPADIPQVVIYGIYLLPDKTALNLATHLPIATAATTAPDTLRSFTGDSFITTDSAGTSLVHLGAYNAYVVSVDGSGEKAASTASAPATLIVDGVGR